MCQQITNRGRANTLGADHLERFAVWSANTICALPAPVRYFLFDTDEI
jgi:hypothetical protein